MEDPLKDFAIGDPFQSWWPFIIAIIVGIITTIRSYFGGLECPSSAIITGKTVVVTGGSSGIGLATVIELAKRGGKIIIGSPDSLKADQEIQKLKSAKKVPKDAVVLCKTLDLASFASVKNFADSIDEDKIDIMINNAGIVFHPFEKTVDGYEKHLQVNYLGHFLLTHLLLPKLEKSDDARIINVSGKAHYNGNINLNNINGENEFESNKAFEQSKLALVIMSKYMSQQLEGKKIKINSMQPGIVRGTNHLRYSPFSKSVLVRFSMYPWMWLLAKSPEQGAQTIIYMAVAQELHSVTGQYFSDCSTIEPSPIVNDEQLNADLYKESCRIVQEKMNKEVKTN